MRLTLSVVVSVVLCGAVLCTAVPGLSAEDALESARLVGGINDIVNSAISKNCPVVGFAGKTCPGRPKGYTGEREVWADTRAVGGNELWGVIGVGYNPTDNTILLPAVGLTYASASAKFPTQAKVSERDANKRVVSAKLNSDVFSYSKTWAFGKTGAEQGYAEGGLFAFKEPMTVLIDKYFKDLDLATATSGKHSAYEVSFKAESSLSTDSFLQQALDYLPATYNAASKASYVQLIEYWGTHYTTDASVGGVISQMNYVESCVWRGGELNTANIVDYAKKDFSKSTGGAGGAMPASYQESRKLGTLNIKGGNPALTNLAQRIATFKSNPSQISFVYKPIVGLVKNAQKRAALTAAIKEYTGAKYALYEQDVAAAYAKAVASATRGRDVYVMQQIASYRYKSPTPPAARGNAFKPVSEEAVPMLVGKIEDDYSSPGFPEGWQPELAKGDGAPWDGVFMNEEGSMGLNSTDVDAGDCGTDSLGKSKKCYCPYAGAAGPYALPSGHYFIFARSAYEVFYCARFDSGELMFSYQNSAGTRIDGPAVLDGCSASTGAHDVDGLVQGLACCQGCVPLIFNTPTSECTGNRCSGIQGTRGACPCPYGG